MNTNLHLLFWDKRRVTGRAKEISPLPPPGPYSQRATDENQEVMVLLGLWNLFIYHCFSSLTGLYQFEIIYVFSVQFEFRSAEFVLLMNGTRPLTVGMW